MNLQLQVKRWINFALSYPLPTYLAERHALPSTISNIDYNLLDLTDPVQAKNILLDSNSLDINTANTNVLNATTEYVPATKRFDTPPF